MSFKDQLREILDDYSDKYSTGLQLSNIVKLDKATDQAIASIVELVDKDIIGEHEDEVIYDSEAAEATNDYDAEVRNMFRYTQSERLTQEDTE